MDFLHCLHTVADREDLTVAQARAAMTAVLAGEPTVAQLAAFLAALKVKGETVDELHGFALSLREHATPVPVDKGSLLLDTCGTGGDNSGSFNISTVTAFVLAACGVRVAKHGNRSLSSVCGSADVLEGLGVRVDLTPDQMADCVREVGIGFLFAPLLHPALRHAQQARRELKMRTAFNLLGPLANPAGADVQIVGAPSLRAARLMAEVLARLGLRRGMVVHGADGLDEVTTTARTHCFRISQGVLFEGMLEPEHFGVPRAAPEDLQGGSLERNVEIARAVLNGEQGPRRDIVVVNAAVALVLCGMAANYAEGAAVATAALESGAATEKLERLVAVTQRVAHPR